MTTFTTKQTQPPKRVVMASTPLRVKVDPQWATGELPPIPTHEAVLAMIVNGDVGGVVGVWQLAVFYRAMALAYEGEIERLPAKIEGCGND